MAIRLGRGRVPRGRPAAALTVLAILASGAAGQQPGAGSQGNAAMLSNYEAAARELLPLTPDLIVDFNERLRAARGAAEWRPFPDHASTDADLVSLEPGSPAPSLRLAPGVATVVTFADAAGKPWPVAGWVVGNRDAFDLRHPGGIDGRQGPSHLTIAPRVEAGWSNLVVELAGQPIPVILTLSVQPRDPHYRLDVQVLALGPNSAPAAIAGSGAPRAGSRELMQYVAAVDLPASAQETTIENVDSTRVWLTGGESGQMVVRTAHSLIGPAWQEAMVGPSGIRVYRLARAHSLLFSVAGGTVIAKVVLP